VLPRIPHHGYEYADFTDASSEECADRWGDFADAAWMSPSSPAEKIATNTIAKGMAVLRSVDCDRVSPQQSLTRDGRAPGPTTTCRHSRWSTDELASVAVAKHRARLLSVGLLTRLAKKIANRLSMRLPRKRRRSS
jgi:hypothetical protein